LRRASSRPSEGMHRWSSFTNALSSSPSEQQDALEQCVFHCGAKSYAVSAGTCWRISRRRAACGEGTGCGRLHSAPASSATAPSGGPCATWTPPTPCGRTEHCVAARVPPSSATAASVPSLTYAAAGLPSWNCPDPHPGGFSSCDAPHYDWQASPTRCGKVPTHMFCKNKGLLLNVY